MKKLILIICCFILTGCYNYHELEDLAIASSVLIDYKDEYEISVEVIENEKSIIYKGSGLTISNAFENVILKTKQEIIYNHLNALILTENVSIQDVTAYFLRNPEINNTFYVVLAKDTKVYENADNLGETIYKILNRNKFHTFFDFTQTLYNANIDIFLPVLDQNLYLNKLMTYKDNKPSVILTQKYIELYKILNNISGSYIKANCEDEYFVIKVNEIKTKTKLENDISISTDIEATISEFNCKLDLTKEKDIKKLEDYANKEIENEIMEFIEIIRVNETDILGMNRLINNKYHNLDKTWTQFEYKADAKTHINKKGLLLK